MVKSRYIQIHRLHSSSGAQLSAGEGGQSFKLSYGGVVRTCIPSQAIEPRLLGGIDAALLERGIPSNATGSIETPIYVADAITVHEEDAELMLRLYYDHITVDVPRLISNIEGSAADKWREADRTLAAEFTKQLLHLIATVSPREDNELYANNFYAQFMLIEVGNRQPRSLAGAFRSPVGADPDEAVAALASHLERLDRDSDSDEARRFMSFGQTQIPRASFLNVPALTEWVAQCIRDAEVE